MTNEGLLRKKIEESGVTIAFLARTLGITRESLYNKMSNETEFKASEIAGITKAIHLTDKERNAIFFA